MSDIKDPLEFFEDDDGFIDSFSGRKKLVSLKPLRLTPIPPPDPSGGPQLVAAPWEKPVGGPWVMRVQTYWRRVAGISLTCNDPKVTIATEVSVGLETTITQSIQSTLESALEVKGVGKIGSKITASTGFSFSTSKKITNKLQVEATPPSSGTKQYEVYQPVIIVIFMNLNSGSRIEIENSLMWKDVETKSKSEPECKKEDDKVGLVDPKDLEEEKKSYAYLENVNDVNTNTIKNLERIGIKTIEELAAASPAKVVSAGMTFADAKILIDNALNKLEDNIKIKDSLYEKKAIKAMGSLEI